jgi:hypothetical protein
MSLLNGHWQSDEAKLDFLVFGFMQLNFHPAMQKSS